MDYSLSVWVGIIIGVLIGIICAIGEVYRTKERPPSYWNPLHPTDDWRFPW